MIARTVTRYVVLRARRFTLAVRICAAEKRTHARPLVIEYSYAGGSRPLPLSQAGRPATPA